MKTRATDDAGSVDSEVPICRNRHAINALVVDIRQQVGQVVLRVGRKQIARLRSSDSVGSKEEWQLRGVN